MGLISRVSSRTYRKVFDKMAQEQKAITQIEKDKQKIERFVNIWEIDIQNIETKVSTFSEEVEPIIKQIKENIHNMQKYGDDSTRGAQLENIRKSYKFVNDKLNNLEKYHSKMN